MGWMIAKNDEVKRSKIWRIVTIVSSVLIVVIAVLLLLKLFLTNPLEGEWMDEDGSFHLSFGKNGAALVTVPGADEASGVEVDMRYTLDREGKTVTITADESGFQKLARESGGQYTEEQLKNALEAVVTTFDYSVDRGRLTLTEREYGEQLVLVRE